MTKRKKRLFTPARVTASVILFVAALVIGAWFLLADKNIAVLNPQGIIAAQQKDLIIFTILLSVIVVVPVFVMLGVFTWKYREGNTGAKYTPEVDGNRWLETLWWGIPIIIIAILGYVTVKSTHELDPYKPLMSSVKPLNVQVVALQWKWLFLYPEQQVASVNELRIPVGTPVNFEITADAPMSAFWIPNLGTQTYAMTGMTAKLSLMADKVGSYRGSNSNINGEGYADMHFQAVAMPSRNDFDEWADNLVADDGHDSLGWEEYTKIAKPGTTDKPAFYHLHDKGLYTKVVNQYMPSNHSGNGHDTSHSEGQGR